MPEVEEQIFFHLTSARSNGSLGPVTGMRPALFARFGDLAKLRYDFPVVLASGGDDTTVATLSGIVDGILADIAPKGIAGERLRKSVLRIDRQIRAFVASGATATLAEQWDRAVEELSPRGGAPFIDDATRARAALKLDGGLVACDGSVASRLVTHVWRGLEAQRAAKMRRNIDTLALKLADLVKADHLRSEAGRHADTLRAGVGGSHRDIFDFQLMAKLLAAPSGAPALSASRRARIERTLGALRSQRFFGAEVPFVFAFDRVEDALAAYRGRMDAMADLVRAIAIAELELRGSYVDDRHDLYFDHFDASSLSAEDLALFPDYLVSLSGAADPAERARIIEGLTSGAPLKIAFATGDAFGLGAQLATTAMGLGDAFVLQTSAAQLYRVRDRVRAALEYRGPALMSVFVPGEGASLSPYLVAAAATESRAFPTFSYDPSAGTDWAQRFQLHDDPQPERVWPEHELAYADERLQRTSEMVAFTLADFAVCDAAHASHFARVPRDAWNEHLVPLAAWLDGRTTGDVPFVYAIDADARLHKLVVDERLAQQVRRCADAWHRLRELDDLKHERVAVAPAAEPEAVAAVVATAAAPAAEPEAASAPASDDAYIETPRCTTCNECTGVNPRMFAYNENKQAFIKDRKAGTYADLVQAAENCQVAIIHPGKPLDQNEPGLEDLVKRAEQFR